MDVGAGSRVFTAKVKCSTFITCKILNIKIFLINLLPKSSANNLEKSTEYSGDGGAGGAGDLGVSITK